MTRSTVHEAGQVVFMATVGMLAAASAVVYLVALDVQQRITRLARR